MIFHESVPDIDRERIKQALDDIKKHGDGFHRKIANFIEDTGLLIYLDIAKNVGGSGSVQLADQRAAIDAVQAGDLDFEDAAKYVRLNIARETIDTGGQRGIEGTFVHEGKHAMVLHLCFRVSQKEWKKRYSIRPHFRENILLI